jgi:hypothetical protein
MSVVVLEPLDMSTSIDPPEEAPATEPAEEAAPREAPAAEPAEPAEEAPAPEEVPLPPVPAPKRGKPPKVKTEAPGLPKAKAQKPRVIKPKAPPPEDSGSSDVDETLRTVYNHVAKPDMETAILQFLVNRKQGETAKRKQLWSQLAQM